MNKITKDGKTTELTKDMVMLDSSVEKIREKAHKVKSTFRAVAYTVSEGVLDEQETAEALDGIKEMIEQLVKLADDTLKASNEFVKEAM